VSKERIYLLNILHTTDLSVPYIFISVKKDLAMPSASSMITNTVIVAVVMPKEDVFKVLKCLCQPCYFETKCQLNFELSSFTVDQLFLFYPLSKNRFVRSISLSSFLVYLQISSLLSHFDAINVVGEYLFFRSIINQTNLFVFYYALFI
jgi:hypothetical protein